ncbi:hypothetical protein IV102_35100 [bacterium]|nr:hypothetical protein [bacterium]
MNKSIAISMAALATTLVGWAQANPDKARDPFVDLSYKAPPVASSTSNQANSDLPVELTRSGSSTKNVRITRSEIAPKINVKGIVISPYGARAILADPERTIIVKKGDRLGDYHIANIDPSGVTFAFGNHKWHRSLDK